VALCAAAGALLADAAPAAADCAAPGITTSPADGAAVPPDPTIHVFMPLYAPGRAPAPAIQVSADGVPIAARVEEVSRGESLVALRVAVDTDGQKRLTLSSDAWHAEYAIDPAWRAPGRRPVEIARIDHRVDEWSCSFTRAWFLEIATPADAFRVEWARSPSAWQRGQVSAAVFPHNDMDFWHQRSPAPRRPPAPGSIGLGHLSCFGYTIPAAAVDGPLYVKVTALFADGSESGAWSQPRRIDRPETTASAAIETAVPPAPVLAAPATAGPVDTSTQALLTGLAITGAAILATGILVVALLLSRRSRHRRLSRTAPPPR
jgi:hypothetical protein